jgi:hypothetical protein
VAFSLAFDLPIVWFLLPPPGTDDELTAAERSVQVLATLLLGRDDQLEDLKARMQDLRQADPGVPDDLDEIARLLGEDPTQ